jgi:hypothetical protein
MMTRFSFYHQVFSLHKAPAEISTVSGGHIISRFFPPQKGLVFHFSKCLASCLPFYTQDTQWVSQGKNENNFLPVLYIW